MNRGEFLRKVDSINVWSRGEKRAPHKPLLLLLALGRVLNGQGRLVSYRDEVGPRLKELLRRFGPPRRTVHPEFPFRYLRNDGLWEIPDWGRLRFNKGGDVSVGQLRKQNIEGGFPEAIHELLCRAPEVAHEAAQRLLDGHFPESLHDDIRDAVGIPRLWVVRESSARPRDPAFRDAVLREYERRCAICEFVVHLGDQVIGVEAAHIKWHAAGGPDEVFNGLALCWSHHKLFDRGALGLEPVDDDFKILVSSDVNPLALFRDFHGKRLHPPKNRTLDPDPGFVQWHRKEVFRDPPLSW